MNLNLLFENLTNPALLYFILGIVAVYLKSDLEIPKILPNSYRYIFYLRLVLKADKNFLTKPSPMKSYGRCYSELPLPH